MVILSRLKLLVVPSVKELRARFVQWTKPVLATWAICSQNRHLQNDLTRTPPCRVT